MQYRIVPAVTAPLLFAIAGLSRPSPVLAQAASAPGLTSAMTHLGALSRERAARWAAARPVIHPLEEAFLDAAIAKRTFAVRGKTLNRARR
jgi:hypothetical protein